jgi:hypothetical protein
MKRAAVDLTSHLNQTIQRGHLADFPVALRSVFADVGGTHQEVPHRRAVVRQDTGDTVAVVSDRYTLVPHQHILDTIETAIAPLDVGQVPRGIYVSQQGARMRAIYKFPALAQPVQVNDELCPCLQIQNTYDGTTRITIQIGAFRFVCTNLAVGGSGVFAGGFMSVHSGEIPIAAVAEQLSAYLTGFDRIMTLYRTWADRRPDPSSLQWIFDKSLKQQPQRLWEVLTKANPQTVYAAYNVATHYATHQMRSYWTAFTLLERINTGFQKAFPPS